MGLKRDVVDALRAEASGLRKRAEVIDILLQMNGFVNEEPQVKVAAVRVAPPKTKKATAGRYTPTSATWQNVLTALSGGVGMTAGELYKAGHRSVQMCLPHMLKAGAVVRTSAERRPGQIGKLAAVYTLPVPAEQATNGAIHASEVSPY